MPSRLYIIRKKRPVINIPVTSYLPTIAAIEFHDFRKVIIDSIKMLTLSGKKREGKMGRSGKRAKSKEQRAVR